MRKLFIGLVLSILIIALSQSLFSAMEVQAQNTQCSDRPTGDRTNACANTRFVGSAVVASSINVTNHALAIGTGLANVFNSTGPCTASQIALWVSGVTADPSCTSTLPSSLNIRLTIPSTSYFVDDISGNDSNACTSATTGACKTLNGVVARIGSYDLNFQAISVSVAAPAVSYAGMSCLQPWVGYGTVTFTGNTTTPTNVLVAGGASAAFDIENGCSISLRGFSVSTVSGAGSVQAIFGGRVTLTRMDFASVGSGLQALYSNRESSYIELTDSLGVSTIHTGALAASLIQASHSGEVRISCTTACLSFTANVTYSQFVLLADHGDIVGTPSASFALNGFTVTGNQWDAISTGSVQWNGLFPPNNADIPGTSGSGVTCYGSGTASGPQSCLLGGPGGTSFNEFLGGANGTLWRNQANSATLATLLNSGFFGLGSGNITPQYSFSVSGNVTTGVVGALPAATNTVAQVIGKDTFTAALGLDGFGAQAIVAGSRADGTAASKSAIAAANEALYANFAYGWNGTLYGVTGGFIIWSSEAYTATHTGSYMAFYSTPTATTTLTEAMRLQASGGLSLGNVAIDPGVGGLAVKVLMSTGTVPIGTTGSCVASSFVGGSTAGKFSAAICAAGTIILSALPTAPNGYTCNAQDQTTPADTLKQTANTVSSVTFTATTAAADVIVFQCMGW